MDSNNEEGGTSREHRLEEEGLEKDDGCFEE